MLADKTGKETEEMRKEDMKESFEHALYPLLKRLERIEKNTDTEEKPEQTGDDERLKSSLKTCLPR